LEQHMSLRFLQIKTAPIVLLGFSWLVGSAHAATLAPVTGLSLVGTIDEGSASSSIPSSVSLNEGGGTASASVSANPFPILHAATSSSNSPSYPSFDLYGIQAEAQEHYFMEVLGPANTNAPVNMQFSLVTLATGNSGANGSLSINQLSAGPPLFLAQACAASGSFGCSGINTSSITSVARLTLPTNQIFSVNMETNSGAETNLVGNRLLGGTSSASLDPFFFIDPSVGDAQDFSLAFSEGVGNEPVSAVPLPQALPMFGAALGALGAFGWRRCRRDLPSTSI
jgi:hypothetical protein